MTETPSPAYLVPTAIMIDGDFFLRRYSRCYGPKHPPERIAKTLFTMCINHLEDKNELYRIFFYDCPPLAKKAHHPLTGEAIDFSKTSTFAFRTGLHKELLRLRKLALRLGRLGHSDWKIRPRPTKELLEKRKTVDELSPDDVQYDVAQKGVDMRIGLDIASLSYKRLVRRIVLVAGDADFVPAAKFARREGIDVILDPMWQDISDDLFEHIDGLNSVCPRPY
jgi:uncharacterized LabA/DUF88 family protein